MKIKKRQVYFALIVVMSAVLGIANTACSTKQLRHALGLEGSEVEVMADDVDDADSASGSQLWAANCMRCHNMRSPSSYSDTQWEVAVHHMRVRANLTAEESEKIVGFLKSAN